MKKAITLVVAITLLSVPPCFALESRKHTFEVGTETSYIKYKEPGVCEDYGWFVGPTFAYTYRGWLPFTRTEKTDSVLRFEGRVLWGEVDYKGTGRLEDIDDYILEFRGLLGYEIASSEKFTYMPYIGFGYRHLNDNFDKYLGGYDREANYFYSPIGIAGTLDINAGWYLTGNAEFDYLWWGKQRSTLTDVPGYLEDVENRQREGYGFRGSLMLKKEFGKLDFAFGPYLNFWHIADSESEYVSTIWGDRLMYEPRNKSTEVGARALIGF
jgi:hypothetical protein